MAKTLEILAFMRWEDLGLGVCFHWRKYFLELGLLAHVPQGTVDYCAIQMGVNYHGFMNKVIS